MTILSLFLIATSFLNGKEKEFRVAEDLKSKWQVFEENHLGKYSGQYTQAIRVPINLEQNRGRWLRIESTERFYLFINSKLMAQDRQCLLLSADSLKKIYPEKIFLSVYQRRNINDLATQWVAFKPAQEFHNPHRPANSFSNFILIASLVLLVYFVALFRTNPRLTLDYLNVIKLFYLRDRDDGQVNLRIASSVNLLFYFFCSLMASMALIVTVNFSKNFFFLSHANPNASAYLWRWILLSLVVFGLLMIKLGFAFATARLFNWRDVMGFQFFNFVRALILSLTLIASISVFCFSVNVEVNYFNLLKIGCVLIATGSVLLYFKLLTRAPFSSFHLFSYLCATEIFPLIILIKVLLF